MLAYQTPLSGGNSNQELNNLTTTILSDDDADDSDDDDDDDCDCEEIYTASCIRLVGLSEVNGNPWASVSEISLLDEHGNVIPKTNWTIHFADSEETVGEDGAAINAIDGDINTFWHTEWYHSNPSFPHEIQINLGSTQKISGFRYLPRQTGPINGTLKDYELYTSTDCSNWTKVAEGSWANDRNEKEVLLKPAPCETPCDEVEMVNHPTQYFVKLCRGTSQARVDYLLKELNSREIWRNDTLNIRLWEVKSFPYESLGQLISNIVGHIVRSKEKSDIDDAIINQVYDLPEDQPSSSFSLFKSLNLGAELGNSPVKVSILDTGISDLQNAVTDDYDFRLTEYTGYDYVQGDPDPDDENGHGTYVAGIIYNVLSNRETPSNVSFDIRKTHDAQGRGTIANLIRATLDAVDAGAQIINMSFSYKGPQGVFDPFQSAIEYAQNQGALVVSSAGNNGSDNDGETVAFPASFPNDNILSVASNNPFYFPSWFSNYGGTSVDVSILGESIPVPNMVGGFENKSGTSYSTAITTALATILATHQGFFYYPSIKCNLINSSRSVSSWNEKNLAGGVINFDRALNNPPEECSNFLVLEKLPDVTQACHESIDPANTGTPAAKSNCSEGSDISITYTDDVSEFCGCGTIFTRVWTATDACGNVATYRQYIGLEEEKASATRATTPTELCLEEEGVFKVENTLVATPTPSSSLSPSKCSGGTIQSIELYDKNRQGYRSLVTLQDGGHYSTDYLPYRFGIRAIVDDNIESVQLNVNGYRVTENYAAYTYPGGDRPWYPAPGEYTITVKAFSQDNLNGSVCDEKTITIYIDQEPSGCSSGYIHSVVLYEKNTMGEYRNLVTLEDGGFYSSDDLPNNFGIRSWVTTSYESLEIEVNGDRVTDNSSPFTFPANGASWHPSPGRYDITVRAYSQRNGQGSVCNEVSLSVYIDQQPDAGGRFNGWDFGADASPATAMGEGPHMVSYSTPGLKQVTLTTAASASDVACCAETLTYFILVSDGCTSLAVEPEEEDNILMIAPNNQVSLGELLNGDLQSPETIYMEGEPSELVIPSNANLLGDSQVTETPDMKLFPNPTPDVVNIRLNHWNGQSAIIILVDQRGAKLYQQAIPSVSGEDYQIDLSRFPTGMYYVEVLGADKRLIEKVVKR